MFRPYAFLMFALVCLSACSVDDTERNEANKNATSTTTLTTGTGMGTTGTSSTGMGTASQTSGSTTPTTLPTVRAVLSVEKEVTFGQVVPGSEASEILTLANTGDAPLRIESIAVEPGASAAFSISFPTDVANPFDPDKQSDAWPEEILPGGELLVKVIFAPSNIGLVTQRLLIQSNGSQPPTTEVLLRGNDDDPCFNVAGDAMVVEQGEQMGDETHVLDFGTVAVGQSRTGRLTVSNCSNNKILTVSPTLTQGQSSQDLFKVTREGGVPLGKFELAPGQVEFLYITVTPAATGAALGRLVLESNDLLHPEMRVDLKVQGASDPCPVAQAAGGELDGAGMVVGAASSTVATTPLRTVKLSSAGSTNADGSTAGLRHQWNVVSRPVRSLARLTPGPQAADPSLFLDVVGRYIVELEVVDAQGIQSCSPARVQIDAIPTTDLYLQLTWETPADMDPADASGSDMDLHFLHPNAMGVWNSQRWDVYWGQITADWGMASDPKDDPFFLLDDSDGFGPEVVELNNPESGKDYTVGVYYFSDSGLGLSTATLQIYIEGALKLEVSGTMINEDLFWLVGSISWPTKQIILKNKISPGASVPGIH